MTGEDRDGSCCRCVSDLIPGFLDLLEWRYTLGLDEQGAIRPASPPCAQLAARGAIDHGLTVIYYLLKGDGSETLETLVAVASGVNLGRIRNARLIESGWPRMSAALAQLEDADLFVDVHHSAIDDALDCAAQQPFLASVVIVE